MVQLFSRAALEFEILGFRDVFVLRATSFVRKLAASISNDLAQ